MSKTKKENTKSKKESWLLHDTYEPGVSCNRIVTRSQTAFLRVKNTPSDLELFSDPSRHQPPGMPHLIELLKGEYGSIPRTIITRSTGQYIDIDKELCEKLKPYKDYHPPSQDK